MSGIHSYYINRLVSISLERDLFKVVVSGHVSLDSDLKNLPFRNRECKAMNRGDNTI
jgi:hypothetical protein